MNKSETCDGVWDMKKHTLKMIAVILNLQLLLTGCQQEVEQQPYITVLTTDPEHIYEEVSEHFWVDAEIDGRKEGNSPKLYLASQPALSKAEIDSFLGLKGETIHEVNLDEDIDFMHVYDVICTNDSCVVANRSVNNNFVQAFFSYTYGSRVSYLYTTVQNSVNSIGGLLVEQYAQRDNSAMYAEPKEFSFASANDAEQSIREALEALGLQNDTIALVRTLYLDHKIMDEAAKSEDAVKSTSRAVQSFLRDGDFARSELYRLETKTWSEDDDAYYLEFTCAFDGIPMHTEELQTLTAYFPSTTINARYNKDGIVNLFFSNPWNAEKVLEEDLDILSAREALDAFLLTRSEVIYSYDTTVRYINLRYCAVQDGNQWLLKPVWEFIMLSHELYADGKLYEVCQNIMIDAVTGDEI